MTIEPTAVLRELYASEINVRFESVWDAGIHWRVGDEYNGYVGTGTAEDWDSAIYEAADYASGYYEHSGFNAWWWSGARSKYWPQIITDAERTKVSSQASGHDRVEPKQKLNPPSNGDEQP